MQKSFTEKVFGHRPDIITRREGEILLPGLVGIEIEYERFSGVHATFIDEQRWWRAHEDGSLRDGGMEINFSQALGGKDAEDAIMLLNHMPRGLSLSERTSTHVHIDVRDLSAQELWNVIAVSMVMDPYLFAAFAPEREDNTFCLPTIAAPGAVLPGNIKDKVTDSVLHNFVDRWAKYSSVNAGAAHEFGSIEYRHAYATTSPEYLFRLVNTLLSIKINGKELDSKALPGMLSEYGVLGFVHRVLGDYANADIITDNMQSKMLKAARIIQDLHRSPFVIKTPCHAKDSLGFKYLIKKAANIKIPEEGIKELITLFSNENGNLL